MYRDSICFDPLVVKGFHMKLMLQCGDKFEIDVHYSLFSKGGLVSFSYEGNSPAKADVDPTVDLDSFLEINAFCDSPLPWRESVSRGSGEHDQQEFAPPFVSELHGGRPRGELLAMVLEKPKNEPRRILIDPVS